MPLRALSWPLAEGCGFFQDLKGRHKDIMGMITSKLLKSQIKTVKGSFKVLSGPTEALTGPNEVLRDLDKVLESPMKGLTGFY